MAENEHYSVCQYWRKICSKIDIILAFYSEYICVLRSLATFLLHSSILYDSKRRLEA